MSMAALAQLKKRAQTIRPADAIHIKYQQPTALFTMLSIDELIWFVSKTGKTSK